MPVNKLIALLTLIVMILAGCGRQREASGWNEHGPGGRLTITGSSTLAPLVREMAKRFETLYPSVRIGVQSGGSSRGIADVRRGTAEIGMISRALLSGESDLAAQTIAIDGISLIVHRANPVSALRNEQVKDIFTGRITNWREAGGPDAPITVVNKAEGRATLELFLRYFDLKNNEVRASIIIGDNQQGIRTVAGDPHAIGYVSIGAADIEASRGVEIALLPISGVAPTLANVRNGSFPLARPLNLVTSGPVSGLTRKFLEFVSSGDVDDLVEAQFFVPVAG